MYINISILVWNPKETHKSLLKLILKQLNINITYWSNDPCPSM